MLVRAHGIGGPGDLPVPLSWALAGAVFALVVSFTVLALAWSRPRYDPPGPGRPVPRLQTFVDATGTRAALRVLGLVVAAYVGWAVLAGPDLATNPALGFLYVLLWVGLVPLSLLFGPVLRALSPVRTVLEAVARVARVDPEHGVVPLPGWVGQWPAALTLLAFAWQELANPRSAYLGSVRVWLAGYLLVTLVGGAVLGTRWLAAADPFEAYSTLVSRLSPWDRDAQGRLVVRSPLAHLATTPAVPGLVAVVAVLLGSTVFDSASNSTAWVRFTQQSSVPGVVLSTLGVLAAVLLVGGLFTAAAVATPSRPDVRRSHLPRRLAHALVPIVVGYVVAHYLTFLVVTGTQTVAQLSDPLGRGDDLLGTAGLPTPLFLAYHPTLLATVQVLAVVLGHVVGVVASHDRATSILPRRDRLTGQLPLLGVMVVFTLGGLGLLFAG